MGNSVSSDEKRKKTIAILGMTIPIVILVALIAAVAIYLRRRARNDSIDLEDTLHNLGDAFGQGPPHASTYTRL